MGIENQENKEKELDSVSREMNEMFKENAVDSLQEALHIKENIELLLEYIKKGVISSDMTLDEVMDKLADKMGELTGEKDEESGEEED